jgi:TatA/E family protein of Tat protein translocase
MFGTLGVQEMVVIFLVALVLFGPKKLPELGRTIGKAITEFRRASNDLKATFEREMQSLERETESLKDVSHAITADIQQATNYDYPYYDSSYGSDSYDSHTATNQSTVSASEVTGAESHEAIEAASEHKAIEAPAESIPQHVEGTVPRSESVAKVEVAPAAETPQHS